MKDDAGGDGGGPETPRHLEFRLRVQPGAGSWRAWLERPGEVVEFRAPLDLARYLARLAPEREERAHLR